MCHYGNSWCHDQSDTSHECPPKPNEPEPTRGDLIVEARKIVNGETMKMATREHLTAVLALADFLSEQGHIARAQSEAKLLAAREEAQREIADLRGRLAEMDGDVEDPFTDDDVALCHEQMARWRRQIATGKPGTYPNGGNEGVWSHALGIIEALRAGDTPDAAAAITGVAIDGETFRNPRTQRLLLHLCQYALAHPNRYTLDSAPAAAQEA